MSLAHLDTGGQPSGAMVALYPDAQAVQALARPGGEPADQLHLTLAFLGDAAQIADPERLASVVEGWAATCHPLVGQVSGPGYFTSNEPVASVALADVPCLSEHREELCEALCSAGYEPASEHGFTPHITLAYDGRALTLQPVPLTFTSVSLVLGGERRTWPLTGVDENADAVMKDAMYPLAVGDPVRRSHQDLSLGEAGEVVAQSVGDGGAWVYDVKWANGTVEKAVRQYELRNVKDLRGEVRRMERIVPVWKDDTDPAAQVVYGVVLQPGVVDSQGDTVSAQEIEQAAHRYLIESRQNDVQHNEQQAPTEVVESYIAPMDMVVGGRKVLKGAWVMAVHITDPGLWQQVQDGAITGFSIGGTAIRDDAALVA